MPYVLDYCIISILFLSITTRFYMRQKKVHNLKHRIYGCLIVLGLCSLALDFIAGALDGVILPLWVQYLVNILFLLCVQLNGPVFVMYTLVLAGAYPMLTKRRLVLMFVPFIAVALLIMASPFCEWGIFYFTDGCVYMHGGTHFALYIVMLLYLIAGGLTVGLKRKQIRKKKQITIYGFLGITCGAMIVQLMLPNYLVNTTANALALTLMYYVLESPSENIDALTGTFNRAAMPQLIREYYEQGRPFTAVIFMLESFKLINHTMGVRRGDAILIDFASYLENRFSDCDIVRVSGNMFAVIDASRKAPLTSADVLKLVISLPPQWTVDGMDAQVAVSAAAANSEDCGSASVMMENVRSIISQHDSSGAPHRVLMADGEFRRKSELMTAYEAAIERAVVEKRVDVHFQPIHDSQGALVALEALCRISDPKLGNLRPDVFIPMAEKNGLIYRIGELVLIRACECIKFFGMESWGLEHIGVNLSMVQCVQSNLADRLVEIVDKYKIEHKLIGFEITETEATPTFGTVRTNMWKLREQGFQFFMDDFGSGYANFDYISELLFTCVKIDHDLLWSAQKGHREEALLEGVISIARKMGLKTVCEGVETKEQANMLSRMNVDMQQGFYYAKAIRPDLLPKYAEKYLRKYGFTPSDGRGGI